MTKLTRRISLVLLCVGANLLTNVHSAKDHCKIGEKKGKSHIKQYWEDNLNRNCNKLDKLEKHGDKLCNGKYKEKNSDDWKEATKKECARDAIHNFVAKIDDQCDDYEPDKCNKHGKNAASFVVSRYCATFSLSSKKSMKKECQKSAKKTCKGYLYNAMSEYLEDHDDCKGDKDPLGNWYDIKGELEDECVTIVDMWVR